MLSLFYVIEIFTIKNILKVLYFLDLAVFINKFHTSFIIYLNQKWRKK